MPTITNRDGWSRRQWVKAIGVTGTGALAGCLGDDGSGDGDDSDDGDTPEEQIAYYMRGGTLFTDLNWNPFSENFNSTVVNFFQEISARTRHDNAEIERFGYADYDYDPETQVLAVELRDDITFHDGSQYTAEDLWTYLELLRLQNPEGSNYESIDVVGDYTLEFTTKDSQNPQIFYRTNVTDTRFEWGAGVWTDWLEQYQDGSDQEARDEVTADLTSNFVIANDEIIEGNYNTGYWQLDDVTETYMDLSVYEDHWLWAGTDDRFDPNIGRMRMWYAEETGTRDQYIVNERVDWAGHGHSWENYEDQMPDYWEQIVDEPDTMSYKMLINWRNREYLQDVNFRRAMAAAIDHENAATNTGTYPVSIHSGMHQSYNQQYWGEEIPSDFIDYGVNADLDLRDEYLDRSAYELEDGQVYDADGQQLEPMRFVIGGSVWGDVAQVTAEILSEAGFPIETNPVDRSNKLTIVQENMGDWDLSTETHYVGTTFHPAEYFWPNTFWGWRIGPGGFGPAEGFTTQVEGWLEDGETHSPYNGKPMVVEIPEDVGSENLDGDTREINIYELYQEITSPVAEERDEEIIRDLSWAWNYHLPDIDVTFAATNIFGNTQKMDFAEDFPVNFLEQGNGPMTGVIRFAE